MVFQYAPGGEFYTLMKKKFKLPESHAMFYTCEIALVLKYFLEKSIVYRYVYSLHLYSNLFL
jgi:hypothetical protein